MLSSSYFLLFHAFSKKKETKLRDGLVSIKLQNRPVNVPLEYRIASEWIGFEKAIRRSCGLKPYEKVEAYSLHYNRPTEEGSLKMALNENTISVFNSFLDSVQKGM